MVLAGLVTIGLVPLVRAYEAHTVNVKVRVEHRYNLIKAARLAGPGEIEANAELIDASGVDSTACNDSAMGPFMVPVETCVAWLVTIVASNPHSYPITGVVITDNFSAEVAGQPIDSLPVAVTVISHSRGRFKALSFDTQYRITWYVTYVSGDVESPETVDNSDVLLPGQSVALTMLVWTKLNPSGRQEYTSPGTYTLNSGPTMKWLNAPLDEGGHQFSSEAPSILVEAYVP